LKKNRIGLITTHSALNYGAALQAYATTKILKNFGEVVVVDYVGDQIAFESRLIRIDLRIRSILSAIKDIFRFKNRYITKAKFKSFAESCLRPIVELPDVHKLDVLVCGSDQIWNPSCVSKNLKILDAYFLEVAGFAGKKMSISSSAGGHAFGSTDLIKVKDILAKFDFVSVREKSLQRQLESAGLTNVSHFLDPTLLVEDDVWDMIKAPLDLPKEYILVYSVPKLPQLFRVLDQVKANLGIPVIMIEQGLYRGKNIDFISRSCGPEEFVEYFRNATYVVTDSFHGMCFSLIMKVKFLIVTAEPHSTRIDSLSRITNTANRVLQDCSVLTDNLIETEVDFEEVSAFLSQHRENNIRELVEKF